MKDLIDRWEDTSDEVPLDNVGVDAILGLLGLNQDEAMKRLLDRIKREEVKE
jgi:hypothetical protein